MLPGRRVRWMEGRHANVDGIPFRGPIRTRSSPALFAAFTIDPVGAADMLPGNELHPARVVDRALLVVAVVDYKDTVIGTYVEFCIGILCTRGPSPALPLLPLLAQRPYGTGVYIYDLPVSTEISVKGGRGIWGMPKRQGNLDFLVRPDLASSQYDLDGQLVMRIDIPRPPQVRLPFHMTGYGYGHFRGMLMKSSVTLQGFAEATFGSGHGTRLLVGDHPRAEPLQRLDINPDPLFSAFVPSIRGYLHDHVETWFLMADTAPGPPVDGIDSIVDLGLSEEWAPPPDRDRSDALLAELDPKAAVGKRQRTSR